MNDGQGSGAELTGGCNNNKSVRQTTITHPLHLLIHKRIPRWIQWRCKSHHNPISQSPTVTSQPPPPPYSHTLQICTRKGLQTFKDDDDDYSHKQGRRSRMNEWMWTRTHLLLAGTIIRQYNHPNSHTQPNALNDSVEFWYSVLTSDDDKNHFLLVAAKYQQSFSFSFSIEDEDEDDDSPAADLAHTH